MSSGAGGIGGSPWWSDGDAPEAAAGAGMEAGGMMKMRMGLFGVTMLRMLGVAAIVMMLIDAMKTVRRKMTMIKSIQTT